MYCCFYRLVETEAHDSPSLHHSIPMAITPLWHLRIPKWLPPSPLPGLLPIGLTSRDSQFRCLIYIKKEGQEVKPFCTVRERQSLLNYFETSVFLGPKFILYHVNYADHGLADYLLLLFCIGLLACLSKYVSFTKVTIAVRHHNNQYRVIE